MNVVIGVDIGASTIKLGAFTTLGQLQYKWSIKQMLHITVSQLQVILQRV